jgi:hypothetical protein
LTDIDPIHFMKYLITKPTDFRQKDRSKELQLNTVKIVGNLQKLGESGNYMIVKSLKKVESAANYAQYIV